MKKLKYVKLFEAFSGQKDTTKAIYVYGDKDSKNIEFECTLNKNTKNLFYVDKLKEIIESKGIGDDSYRNQLISKLHKVTHIEQIKELVGPHEFYNRFSINGEPITNTLEDSERNCIMYNGWFQIGFRPWNEDTRFKRQDVLSGFLNKIEVEEFFKSNNLKDAKGFLDLKDNTGYLIVQK